MKKVSKISKEDLKKYDYYLTVGDLKKFLNDHNLPDDAKVLVQRVEDVYYEKHNWSVYLKKGLFSFLSEKFNDDVDNGEFLNKEEYPLMKKENLKKFSKKELENSAEQYHPAFSCVYYEDDPDILFIDLHY